MKRVLKGGTDIGAMLFWDPGAMPEDFMDRLKRDPDSQILQYIKDKQFLWIQTDADGAYELQAFVDEVPAKSVLKSYSIFRSQKKFEVPTGELWFSGPEYVGNIDQLRKYKHMGAKIRVTPGAYHLNAWILKKGDEKYPTAIVALERIRPLRGRA